MTRRWVAYVGALELVAHAAAAVEEGHDHAGAIPVSTLLFSTINLALFLVMMARFALPQIRSWVRERRAGVVTALEAAAAARAQAQRLQAEWEMRIAELDTTIAAMRAQAREDAEHERQRVLVAAQKAAETIRRDAERAAAYEQRRVLEHLRTELVRQAIQQAEDQVRTQWTPADQARLMSEFLQQVEQ